MTTVNPRLSTLNTLDLDGVGTLTDLPASLTIQGNLALNSTTPNSTLATLIQSFDASSNTQLTNLARNIEVSNDLRLPGRLEAVAVELNNVQQVDPPPFAAPAYDTLAPFNPEDADLEGHCPFSLNTFDEINNPVVITNGQNRTVFQYDDLCQWVAGGHNTNPVTNEPFQMADVARVV